MVIGAESLLTSRIGATASIDHDRDTGESPFQYRFSVCLFLDSIAHIFCAHRNRIKILPGGFFQRIWLILSQKKVRSFLCTVPCKEVLAHVPKTAYRPPYTPYKMFVPDP